MVPTSAVDPRLRLPLALLAALVTVTLPDPLSAGIALALACAAVILFGSISVQFLKRWGLLALLLALTAAPLPFTVQGEARWWLGSLPLSATGIDLACTWWLRGMAAGGMILGLLAPFPYGDCCKRRAGGAAHRSC